MGGMSAMDESWRLLRNKQFLAPNPRPDAVCVTPSQNYISADSLSSSPQNSRMRHWVRYLQWEVGWGHLQHSSQNPIPNFWHTSREGRSGWIWQTQVRPGCRFSVDWFTSILNVIS